MTDEKKKFIRISSEYEGGLTIYRKYALLQDDKPEKIVSVYASCDEGWLVVKNYEDFELENGKIKHLADQIGQHRRYRVLLRDQEKPAHPDRKAGIPQI